MSRVKRISDDTVLQGVLTAMMRTGPAAFTLAAAAAETGLAPATLMLRFGDKQTLIAKAIAAGDGRFGRLVEAAPKARGREAVLDLFWLLTPDLDEPADLADQLSWLGEDFRDSGLNALAKARSRRLRQALAERLPPLRLPVEAAARLLEAQWRGAMQQWGCLPEGRLTDHVANSLGEWLDLAAAGP